jgi:Protein of unknown function (DUF551)
MATKTPEEMAEEYCEDHDECEHARNAFLAGYEAAQKQFAPVRVTIPQENCEAALEAMKSTEQFIKQCVEWTSALTTPKWISVKDRLPEDASDVLIAWSDGVSEACFCDEEWCREGRMLRSVTHWMPLPEAPKE